MSSVAAVALATPAFAAPDRYEQGYSCTGSGAECVQQEMRLEDGNRFDEKAGTAAIGTEQRSTDEPQTAARAGDNDSFGDGVGDDVDEAADEAGDEISNTADEAGDEIGDAADEVGDEIADIF